MQILDFMCALGVLAFCMSLLIRACETQEAGCRPSRVSGSQCSGYGWLAGSKHATPSHLQQRVASRVLKSRLWLVENKLPFPNPQGLPTHPLLNPCNENRLSEKISERNSPCPADYGYNSTLETTHDYLERPPRWQSSCCTWTAVRAQSKEL